MKWNKCNFYKRKFKSSSNGSKGLRPTRKDVNDQSSSSMKYLIVLIVRQKVIYCLIATQTLLAN